MCRHDENNNNSSQSERYCVSGNLARFERLLKASLMVSRRKSQTKQFASKQISHTHRESHSNTRKHANDDDCERHCCVYCVLCVCIVFVYIIQDLVDCVNPNPLNSIFIIIIIIIDAVFLGALYNANYLFVGIENR